MPPRATIQARDGTRDRQGRGAAVRARTARRRRSPARSAPPRRSARPSWTRSACPTDADVGLNGLERAVRRAAAGTPGGTLLAGGRVLARSAPQARRRRCARRSTPRSRRRRSTALAGRFGGIAVMRPRDGEVLAAGRDRLQRAPAARARRSRSSRSPGCSTPAWSSATRSSRSQTSATLEGVELENANGEACGGSLRESFAESCNSVFAPLGAKLGAERLVEAAERFGFNEEPPARSAPRRSTIPPADEIGDDLAVGSTAIGQGKVLTTPLQMAEVAAAIGRGGRAPAPDAAQGRRQRGRRAPPAPETARFIARAMRSVVDRRHGRRRRGPRRARGGQDRHRRAAHHGPRRPDVASPAQPPVEADTTDTDAWFTAFAPLRNPKVAVGVLLVGQGAGGATAAPGGEDRDRGALLARRRGRRCRSRRCRGGSGTPAGGSAARPS